MTWAVTPEATGRYDSMRPSHHNAGFLPDKVAGQAWPRQQGPWWHRHRGPLLRHRGGRPRSQSTRRRRGRRGEPKTRFLRLLNHLAVHERVTMPVPEVIAHRRLPPLAGVPVTLQLDVLLADGVGEDRCGTQLALPTTRAPDEKTPVRRRRIGTPGHHRWCGSDRNGASAAP